MSSFLRGKQAGIQHDLSASIRPELFTPDDQARYGINSQISCLAYDPVQSLLAIGTSESRYGSGKIYVFGQRRVQKILEPLRATTFNDVQFTGNRLVSTDSKNELAIWDLDTGGRIGVQVIAGHIVSIVTDPMLDWVFVGLQNGEVLAYDLDRVSLSRAFRLPNFWHEKEPTVRAVSLVSLALHPRDIGKLLIAYSHGAVVYSFKQNKATQFLHYGVPPGASGGNNVGTDKIRYPRLTHALWHPSGTFVATVHDDGSLVFWDHREEKIVLARTLNQMHVDQPDSTSAQATFAEPITDIKWCCKQNCDDSGLLISGGQPAGAAPKSMTFIDLGVTPVYATATWQSLAQYFQGKTHKELPLPAGAQAKKFLLIPRESPYFAGAQDPIAIVSLLTSGELITMTFPSGYPISPTNQLHPSTFFVHPFITKVQVSPLERARWLAMMEKRDQGEPLLKGGAEGPRPRKRFEERTIIQAAQADSTIRIWDSGHADEIENGQQLQVDMARTLNRFDDIEITTMNMAGNTGEFVVGTRTGEVVVFRWGQNRFYGKTERPQHIDPNPMGLTDISSRSEPALKEGLNPLVLYEMMQGPITAVQISNVGFVAVGSELGFLSLIDLRAPAIIYQAPMTDFAKQEKRTSFLKGHHSKSDAPPKEWPVVIEFGVMTLDEDKYSSICCFVGTNLGKVITFKILPGQNGSYSVQLAGVVAFDDKIISLNPIEADTGKPAVATGGSVAGLREGRSVNVTEKEIRIFRPANSKGASKEFDDILCDAASVAELELQGFAVIGVFGDQTARAFSIPGLKEIGRAPLPMIDAGRSTNTTVTPTGDVFAWTGPSEMAVIHCWGTGQSLQQSPDTMINPKLECPPRPTISNLQWISGTQYVSPLDLDLLVGGPDRPPSKRMLEAAAQEKRNIHNGEAGGPSNPSQEGWGDYLTRQLNERTEKLNIMGDSMDGLQQQSQGWATDVNKYISKQKRSFVMNSVKSKFF
ncbi:Lethal(2) giant larvae protein-like protein [Emericellopsis cladophorae]|uniref:Lethal(2) giant larvae protein-like protein n=1 Tax=Emericellopsis cladophorae TaxID=2686198 RepID=A0A9P9XUP3_9HYPO|nr:Lethal(2) giant larvae protein-like protein [Emericellopsis cladophorae]KAI6777938.1 Lethal(2) giant larvae protein-like protein [Emericellopsis cladophorae]